jgi:hypothetical protein
MQHSATRQPPDEAVTSGRAKRRPERRRPVRLETHDRFGGTEGNEILTSATAVVLTGLLVAEGLTIVHMGGLVSAHMFIGMVLIPPVLLKLASTGYRFVRYYTGSRVYRAKGPPPLPMRLLAPALVATTLGVFVTGVLLLLAGHKSDTLLLVHKVSFIVWGVVFAVHFLAYVPRVVRSLRADWGAARREAVRRRPEGAAGGRRARRRRCAGTLAAAGDGRLARLGHSPKTESCPRRVYNGPRVDQEPDRERAARHHHADHEDPLERALPLRMAACPPHQGPCAIEPHRKRDRAEDREEHPHERDQDPEGDRAGLVEDVRPDPKPAGGLWAPESREQQRLDHEDRRRQDSVRAPARAGCGRGRTAKALRRRAGAATDDESAGFGGVVTCHSRSAKLGNR